ncbi:hypothetical protein OIU76_021400 [Salix suchowensis]|nr:hypothetical protein OIU76_021400 [Salix suchowensis]
MADTHLTGVMIDLSPPAIAQVQGNSTTSEDAKVSLPLWLNEIPEEYKKSENNRKPNIPEVPVQLKGNKRECYRPLAVSIGPYHYSDSEGKLQQVEKLKFRMMIKFVEDSKAPREDFYINVKKELQKARGCYDESITEKFSDEEFIKMMFIDGCFILQFMHCLDNESLEMSDRQIFHVKQDLLLLENQLPFAVLDSLRKQSCCLSYEGLLQVHVYLGKLLLQEKKKVSLDWSPPPGKTQPDHLLQLLYYKSMSLFQKKP